MAWRLGADRLRQLRDPPARRRRLVVHDVVDAGRPSLEGSDGRRGGVLREVIELTNDSRLDIPSTIICTGYTSQQYKDAMGEDYAWLAGLKEVRNITWVDLPTSHWPMWSRPKELAEIIGDAAKAHVPAD